MTARIYDGFRPTPIDPAQFHAVANWIGHYISHDSASDDQTRRLHVAGPDSGPLSPEVFDAAFLHDAANSFRKVGEQS